MFDVLLGTVLGMGLVLAFQELRRLYTARKVQRHEKAVAEAIALLNDHTVIGSNQVDWDSLKTWGYVEPTDAGPCGCHRTWTEHYEHWDYTCKCHRTKAEHDLSVAVNRAQSTPDTPW